MYADAGGTSPETLEHWVTHYRGPDQRAVVEQATRRSQEEWVELPSVRGKEGLQLPLSGVNEMLWRERLPKEERRTLLGTPEERAQWMVARIQVDNEQARTFTSLRLSLSLREVDEALTTCAKKK
jgi:hypothetical protein